MERVVVSEILFQVSFRYEVKNNGQNAQLLQDVHDQNGFSEVGNGFQPSGWDAAKAVSDQSGGCRCFATVLALSCI